MTYRRGIMFNEEIFFAALIYPQDQPLDKCAADSEVTDLPSDELSAQTSSRRLYLFGLSSAFNRNSPNEVRGEDE